MTPDFLIWISTVLSIGILIHFFWHELKTNSKRWYWEACEWSECFCPVGIGGLRCIAQSHNEWVEKRFYRRWIADLREWWTGFRADFWGR